MCIPRVSCVCVCEIIIIMCRCVDNNHLLIFIILFDIGVTIIECHDHD